MNAIRYTRIPAAFLLALLLTAAMFSALNGLTSATYVPTFKPSAPIEFKRPREDTDTQNRREIARPDKPPLIDIDLPRVTKATNDGPNVEIARTQVGDIALPPITGANLGNDRDVSPVLRVDPVYPQRAAERGTEGWVQVRFNISASGGVTDLEVVASEPTGVFEKAATAAVARWRYNPKVENGEAVERRGIENLLRFTLPDK